jgi:hypothetical protein
MQIRVLWRGINNERVELGWRENSEMNRFTSWTTFYIFRIFASYWIFSFYFIVRFCPFLPPIPTHAELSPPHKRAISLFIREKGARYARFAVFLCCLSDWPETTIVYFLSVHLKTPRLLMSIDSTLHTPSSEIYYYRTITTCSPVYFIVFCILYEFNIHDGNVCRWRWPTSRL